MKIGAVLVLLSVSIITSACISADAQAPLNTSTPISTQVITPTTTNQSELNQSSNTPTFTLTAIQPTYTDIPTQTPFGFQPYQTFNLTLNNPSGWDTHLFVDNVYAITIPAGETWVYNDLKGGERTIHFCQVKDVLTCEPPKLVFINGDLEWVVGEDLPKSIVIKSGLEIGSTLVPFPALIPPENHKIKINNRTPWEIYIYIEHQIRIKPTETPSIYATESPEKMEDTYVPFLVIPPNSHRTYDSLTTGTYTFIHCTTMTMKNCFLEKTIKLTSDTEWYVYP
jgi:hypothetical protein